MDKRVSRVVGWLLENYPSSQLTVRYDHGQENIIIGMMYRWSGQFLVRKETSELMLNDREEVNVLGKEDWKRLHNDHVVLTTMLHRCAKRNIQCDKKELDRRFKEFKLCERHVFLRRVDVWGCMN